MTTNRDRIMGALQLQDGLTSGEIIEYLQASDPALDKQRIYNALNYLIGVGVLNKEGKRHYLVNGHVASNGYKNGSTAVHATIRPLPEVNRAPQLAGYQQGRKGRQIMIVSSPLYYDAIVRIELVHAGGAFTVPLFGAVTICTGPDIPKLAPEQESYRGIRAIRLTLANGKSEEIRTNENGHVTIAPTQE